MSVPSQSPRLIHARRMPRRRPEQVLITLTENCAIQVIDSIDDLGTVKRHREFFGYTRSKEFGSTDRGFSAEYAAFVRSNMALVLWSDEVSKLVPHAQNVRSFLSGVFDVRSPLNFA